MANFKYRVRDRTGKAVIGVIEAPNVQMAGEQLYQQGYLPIEIREGMETHPLTLSEVWERFRRVRLEEIIFFSQQLSTLYKAGVPLLTGLTIIAQQTENKKLRGVVEAVGQEVEKGSALFEAMAKYPDVFSPVYINMIRAGETSGRLSQSLDRFVTLAERELRTRQRVKEAIRYPKIVVLSLIIAFAVLITFVIPRFVDVFTKFNAPLPLPTRIMIGVNNLFHTFWYVCLMVMGGVPLLLKRYLGTPKGKYYWDRLKLRIPVLGPLFLKIALSRFTYTFVMLNRSGIPILRTLEITASTIDNVILSQTIEKIRAKIQRGSSLAGAVAETGHFPPLVVQMLSVGESSGTLDEMLTRVTEYYDLEVENSIKKLSTYVEPALTLFLGVVVLLLALAVFLPWWNMASLFK